MVCHGGRGDGGRVGAGIFIECGLAETRRRTVGLAGRSAARHGTQLADCTEGGQCVGFIRPNDWLRYDAVDFGTGTESVTLLAAADAGAGGVVELRLDKADGELLGTCEVASTDGWQKWQSFTAHIKKTGGKKNLCLVFQPLKAAQPDERFRPVADGTVIYAQFPGVDPNTSKVEINVRQTGFTPEPAGHQLPHRARF